MVKKAKGFDNWVTAKEAAKMSGFTKGYIFLMIKLGRLKKIRQVGRMYLVNVEEIQSIKRIGRGPDSQYKK
jgi:hypothetical protein